MDDEEFGAAKYMAVNLEHGGGLLSTRNHSFIKDRFGRPLPTNTKSVIMKDGDDLKNVAYTPGTAQKAMLIIEVICKVGLDLIRHKLTTQALKLKSSSLILKNRKHNDNENGHISLMLFFWRNF